MTTQALRIDLLRRGLRRIENLGDISAGIHVRFAGSVATFAGHPALAVHLGQLRVGVRSKSLRNLVVTSRAAILPNEISRGGRRLAALCAGWIRSPPWSSCCSRGK